jgi:hypothetical protein
MADVTSSDHHSSPWTQRGFILAAAFIAGLVLLGLALLLIGIGGGNDDANRRPSTKAPASAPARKDPNASICGLPAGNQQVPAAPPETRWELVGKIAAPSAPRTTGPGIERGELRECYAHSPTGALFAAANFVAVASVAKDSPQVLRELTAAGAARDESLRANARSTDEGSAGGLQVAGFRVSSYSANEATLDLAFAVEAKGYVHLALPMRWERGDWKVVVTTAQGPFAGYESIANLSGFVPWSGT